MIETSLKTIDTIVSRVPEMWRVDFCGLFIEDGKVDPEFQTVFNSSPELSLLAEEMLRQPGEVIDDVKYYLFDMKRSSPRLGRDSVNIPLSKAEIRLIQRVLEHHINHVADTASKRAIRNKLISFRQMVSLPKWKNYNDEYARAIFCGTHGSEEEGFTDRWLVNIDYGWTMVCHFGPEDSDFSSNAFWMRGSDLNRAIKCLHEEFETYKAKDDGPKIFTRSYEEAIRFLESQTDPVKVVREELAQWILSANEKTQSTSKVDDPYSRGIHIGKSLSLVAVVKLLESVEAFRAKS